MNYDAIIIGAGISGLYQLHQLRRLGLQVHVLEAGTGVGGTWYWNRYPGARFDSESYSYGYSFSEELLDEWQWSEHFAAQPETLRYVNYVADKFDLRRDITFESRVTRAEFQSDANRWCVTTEDGIERTARWLVTAVGPLSAPVMPNVPGIEDFAGEWYHTANWPREPVRFEGKRVAVIGTGATGVQTIQEVAKTAQTLHVFQRHPNWCAPLGNRPITADEQTQIRADYDRIFALCRESHGGFMHAALKQNALEVSAEEREAFFEQRYNEPGFGIWMGNYRDVLIDEDANALMSDFIARKIRSRVHDAEVAEKLIPKDHGFGTRRVPMETGYYEVYNQDNVELVDISASPISRIDASGIQVGDRHYDFDLIIYATGFDAVRGSFDRIEFVGEGGIALKDQWKNGPRSYLGLSFAGFPNMLTLVGPHNAATFCNIPRCIEQNVEWATDFVKHLVERDIQRFEAEPLAQDEWMEHVAAMAEPLLLTKIDSWMTGINSNLDGRNQRTHMVYAGGVPRYREKCDEVAAAGYAGFRFVN